MGELVDEVSGHLERFENWARAKPRSALALCFSAAAVALMYGYGIFANEIESERAIYFGRLDRVMAAYSSKILKYSFERPVSVTFDEGVYTIKTKVTRAHDEGLNDQLSKMHCVIAKTDATDIEGPLRKVNIIRQFYLNLAQTTWHTLYCEVPDGIGYRRIHFEPSQAQLARLLPEQNL